MSADNVESVFQMAQTEMAQTEMVQTEMAQTEMAQTEILEKKSKLNLQIGWDTDIGGCNYKPNQDKQIIIPFVEHDGCLIGLADGHGVKGEQVSELCEKLMTVLIGEKMLELLENPVAFLEYAFEYIQGEIVDKFRDIRCGTTFSLILVLEKKMWIANVGDSTGILCAKHPIFKPSHLKFEKDVAIPDKVVISSEEDCGIPTNYIVLTSEGHSPENPEEYKRMRNFKTSEENPNHAELLCVYDKQRRAKHLCTPVFNISEDGEPSVRLEDGSFEYYHKNVRKEKGTYVSDRYGENVLASTRSMGDYALNILGVSHKPEIRSIDLVPVFERLKEKIEISKEEENKRRLDAMTTSETSEITKEVDPDPKTVCVVLCSDGVWDNWIYDHVQKFVMDKSCLKAIEKDVTLGAQRVCKSFMLRNQAFARKNFGSNSDNATGVVMYITEE
jgi:serine/threonine protein phosphatase PrpC